MARGEKIEGVEIVHQEVVTAVYKLNLHCQQCANAIQKPLMRTEGVRNVDIEEGSGKITVKGKIDPVKIHELIKKSSRRKVELISPLPKKPEPKVEKKVEKKEAVVKTTVLKIDMHCENCQSDLKKKMLELEGVYTVKTNREKEICTVEGTVEPEKLIKYLHKKLRKHVEIVQQKEEKEKKEEKEEKNEKEKKEEKDKEGESSTSKEKHVEKEEKKLVEYKIVPYIIYYDHPPELFSDENPNACIIF